MYIYRERESESESESERALSHTAASCIVQGALAVTLGQGIRVDKIVARRQRANLGICEQCGGLG